MGANPEALLPRWDDLQLFLVVANTGSLLAAGRELGVATSTLSRRLTKLEHDLGRTLLERRANGARLTESGRTLARAVAELDAGLRARLRAIPAEGPELTGTLRISAGDGFTDAVVTTAKEFAARHPRVEVELAFESHVVDVARGAADLAIRTVHRREASLVYTRAAELPYGLFASADYLAHCPAPRSLARLATHRVIGFAPPLHRAAPMGWLRANGVERFAFRADSFGGYRAAVAAGLGIGALPALAAASLVAVLPRATLEPLPVYVCTHRDRRREPHLKAFAAMLTARLQGIARAS